MTRDDRPPSRDRDQTNPDGLAARSRDPAGEQVDSARPNDSTRKAFNPWRFGFHTVSPDHRRELLEMQLPETPAERLFDPSNLGGKTAAAGSGPPALTVDADDGAGGAGDSARKADTLRLRPGPPLVHPLRLAAPWAAGAALIVVLLLWLLVGGASAPRDAGATAAMPPVVAVPTPSRLPAPVPRPAEAGVADTNANDLAAPTGNGEVPAPERPEGGKPPRVSAPAPTPPTAIAPTPVQSATTPPKSKPAPPDDASPFGTWTAPPRD